MWRMDSSRNNDQRGIIMKRDIKTLLMGTVALMAGVGLASAQGMRDAPGNTNDRSASSGSSSQMTPGASGSQGEMKGKQGKAEKSEKSEPRGQAQQGPSRQEYEKGQAKSERPARSTTGQGASDKDELKSKSSAKSADKPAEASHRPARPRTRRRTRPTPARVRPARRMRRRQPVRLQGQDREVDNRSGFV